MLLTFCSPLAAIVRGGFDALRSPLENGLSCSCNECLLLGMLLLLLFAYYLFIYFFWRKVLDGLQPVN